MRYILPIIFSMLALGSMTASEPQVSEAYEYKISKSGDGYRLRANVKYQWAFATEDALETDAAYISEPYFAEVKNVKVHRKGKKLRGTSVSSGLVEFEDIFLSSHRIFTVDLGNKIKVGDRIEIKHDIEYDAIEYLPLIYVDAEQEMIGKTITYKHPADVTVGFEFFFPADSITYEILRPSAKETILKFGLTKERKYLPFLSQGDIYAAVLVKLYDSNGLINPATPGKYLEWYGGLITLQPEVPDSLPDALAPTTDNLSDIEKLRGYHDYVRSHIRYVADEREQNAIVPRPPATTLARTYGDCKDRAYLISALAARDDIPVHMMLVSTTPRPRFESVHTSLFDHVICAYKSPQGMVYFDPTGKYTEFGNVSDELVGTDGLVLDPENPRWETIRRTKTQPRVQIDINADLADPENGAAIVTLRNDAFSMILRAQKELTKVAMENLLSGLISGSLYRISLDYYVPQEIGEDFISFTAQADLSKFLVESTTKVYVPQTVFLSVDRDILEREDDEFAINLPHRDHLVMNLHLLTGELTAASDSLELQMDESVQFSASLIENDHESVDVRYEILLRTGKFEGKSKSDFIEFCRAYLKGKRNMFVLRRDTE